MVFCGEFDCYVHPACIRARLSADPEDPEMILMAAELGIRE